MNDEFWRDGLSVDAYSPDTGGPSPEQFGGGGEPTLPRKSLLPDLRSSFFSAAKIRKSYDISENRFDKKDNSVIDYVLGKARYRVTTINFLAASSPSLDTRQRAGLIQFVGLVNMADDAIDNGHISTGSQEDMRQGILGHKIRIGDDEMTIENILQLTKNKFPPDKQALIDSFIEKQLTFHASLHSARPGDYSYEQAQNYREQTSTEYSRVGLELADASVAETASRIQGGRIVQMIDDATDLISDFNSQAINPLIGLAADTGELPWIQKAAHTTSGFSKGKPWHGPNVLRLMPKARQAYRQDFEKQLANFEGNGKLKFVYRKMGNIL